MKLHDRDRPLTFHWTARDLEWVELLGLPSAHSRNFADARSAVLLNAIRPAQGTPHWISYSRNHNHYNRARRRYHGRAFTCANVTRAVDQAAEFGFVESQVAEQGALGKQSRFRATAKLLRSTMDIPAVYQPSELIRLKDINGRLIDYRDTDATCRMRREIAAINEAISSVGLDLVEPEVTREETIIRIGDAVVYPEMKSLWRIFSRGSFAKHGRMYGGWWQCVPKHARAFLTINREPVAEPDYPSHHCRMCYVLAEAAIPIGDLHSISGWETEDGRKLCKLAFNILINADTQSKALAALAQKIEGRKYTTTASREKAAAVIDAVVQRHKPVANLFCTDAAMTLMRFDSEMALLVVSCLIDRGIVALPIHDSFVVQQRYEGELREAMDEAWVAFCSGKITKSFQRDSRKQSYKRATLPGGATLPVTVVPAARRAA